MNDDFSSDECFDSDSGLGEQWANWAVQYGITLRSLTRMSKILHVHHQSGRGMKTCNGQWL